jgi:hypothetical protein
VTDKYFDLKDLSEYSSLSVKTLRKHLLEIDHYRVGGKIIVRKGDFDNWMLQFKVPNSENIRQLTNEIIEKIELN